MQSSDIQIGICQNKQYIILKQLKLTEGPGSPGSPTTWENKNTVNMNL